MVAKSHAKPGYQRALINLSVVLTTAVLLTALYWMRSIFIPIAMAIFLAFVLVPPVAWLQRRGLGRTPAVILTVTVAMLLFLGGSTLIASQLVDLSDAVAEHKDEIKKKVGELRSTVVGDGESKWARIAAEMEQTLIPNTATTDSKAVMVEPSSSWFSRLGTIAGPIAEVLGQAAFVFILVVFFLLAKEDLQDRAFRILGNGTITSATRALGEATDRLSRYLLTQLLVNVSFGILCAIGLFFLGVKYSLLWGFLGCLMRYIPYIGTWIGVILPTIFAAALSDGWMQPIGVLVIFLGLETISNNFLEPRLFGKSLGVSEVAFLVSAAFWAFMWGPIGLILSGPITACLVMFGKHLSPFRPLAVLLGTDPPLTPAVALYRRLMARNQEEAVRVVEEAKRPADAVAVFDEVVLPALNLVKQAKADEQFDVEEEQEILGIANEVLEEVVLGIQASAEHSEPSAAEKVRLLACPATDETDRLTLVALAGLLPQDRWEVQVTGVATLTSELLTVAEQFAPQVICIGTLPPYGIGHVRYLCKRLRARFPNAHILVGRWATEETESLESQFLAVGATEVTSSFSEARTMITARHSISSPVATSSSKEKRVPAGQFQDSTFSGTPRA